ncbi:MAG: hypothetical protein NTU57_03140 [Candidatus Aenigmarchaeota archaeon]|nr:hypothetical protein [Candidatus Aenigmarchaeota archaeon]
MANDKKFESYPVWMMLVYYFASFSVYAAGLYLTYMILPLFSLLLFIYVAFLEIQVLRGGCVRCYYYDKRCVCGKGKLAKVFFKKDEKRKFNENKLTAKNFIPTMLPTIIALAAGAYLTYASWPDFSLFVIGLAIWPLIIMFAGNPIVYGKIACPHCKQGELGCPACEFFMKKQHEKK